MALPTEVKVGGLTFKITKIKNLQHDHRNVYGLCDTEELTIQLDKDKNKNKDQELNTVVHELLHAVYYERGIPDPENTIVQISNGLCALLKNNPKLVKYIIESL